jgi:NAD(P)-dependent dehydrogenase (short-subunit alcohol dehydrogenase family)
VSGLAARLTGKRVVICAGAGGVGKTTVSAAVALGLAARGRRVAVVTIDPARRLAEALGLDELGNQPRLVDHARLSGSGIEIRGELWAMMLDVKRTFDDLIARLAPDPSKRDEILANPIYRHISTAVAGSQEYSAVAKLFELPGATRQLTSQRRLPRHAASRSEVLGTRRGKSAARGYSSGPRGHGASRTHDWLPARRASRAPVGGHSMG